MQPLQRPNKNFWVSFIDLYKRHLCLKSMKHWACRPEHVFEWLHVVAAVVVGLRVTAATQ